MTITSPCCREKLAPLKSNIPRPRHKDRQGSRSGDGTCPPLQFRFRIVELIWQEVLDALSGRCFPADFSRYFIWVRQGSGLLAGRLSHRGESACPSRDTGDRPRRHGPGLHESRGIERLSCTLLRGPSRPALRLGYARRRLARHPCLSSGGRKSTGSRRSALSRAGNSERWQVQSGSTARYLFSRTRFPPHL